MIAGGLSGQGPQARPRRRDDLGIGIVKRRLEPRAGAAGITARRDQPRQHHGRAAASKRGRGVIEERDERRLGLAGRTGACERDGTECGRGMDAG